MFTLSNGMKKTFYNFIFLVEMKMNRELYYSELITVNCGITLFGQGFIHTTLVTGLELSKGFRHFSRFWYSLLSNKGQELEACITIKFIKLFYELSFGMVITNANSSPISFNSGVNPYLRQLVQHSNDQSQLELM